MRFPQVSLVTISPVCRFSLGRRGSCLLLLLLLTLPGCGGCLKSATPVARPLTLEEEEEKLRAEEQRRREQANLPLNLGELRIQPHDRQANVRGVKPGHWMTALQAARANQGDVQAELLTFSVSPQGSPRPIDSTPYRLITSRPAALPKGQTRYFETLHRIPLADEAQSETGVALERLLVPRTGARDEMRDRQPVTAMPGHQFYLVILAETPDAYTFVRRLHSVALPPSYYSDRPATRYYHVIIPERTTGIPPLPTHSLAWTSISCLILDNLQPNLLAPAQQSAMLDWLHWGGHLVISGPGSLEKLSGSFLEPYLPADRLATVALRGEDFAELNESWSLVERKTGNPRRIDVDDAAPVVGLTWEMRAQGRAVKGTGNLVVERRVGAGRIAVTAFGLADRTILNWGSYDSFFNGALLRRPARLFAAREFEEIDCSWSGFPGLATDARLISGMRYFSRDAAREEESTFIDRDVESRDRRIWGAAVSTQSGVASWNDLSAVSEEARETLRDAAGISIPSSSFVLGVVAVYLLVLTPLNWGFFRLMGRVEWAWFAAPFIAIAAAFVVVRMAQLDIGFARSQTELATLEIQADYPRAHLTRYTALYSSLSTRYEITHDDPNALVQPLSMGQPNRRGSDEPTTLLTLHRGREVKLSGLSVMSNSTSMWRAEQILDLGGTLSLEGDAELEWNLANGSEIRIRDAGVLYRDQQGEAWAAWLGDVPPKSRRRIALEVPLRDGLPLEGWRGAAVFSGGDPSERSVPLRRLGELVMREWPVGRGEVRLIGWSEEIWPGQTITPQANQQRNATLIVVHLRHPIWRTAQRDRNLLVDVADPERIPASPLFDEGDNSWDDDEVGELTP